MSDTISRQAAIDALDEYFGRIGKLERRGLTKGERAISLDVVGAIRTLPSVEAEQVRYGHWMLRKADSGYHTDCVCSECKSKHAIGWDYCPNCGAKMDGGTDETK